MNKGNSQTSLGKDLNYAKYPSKQNILFESGRKGSQDGLLKLEVEACAIKPNPAWRTTTNKRQPMQERKQSQIAKPKGKTKQIG